LLGTSILEFNSYRITDINYSSTCLQGKDLRDLEGKSVSLHRAFRDEGINVTLRVTLNLRYNNNSYSNSLIKAPRRVSVYID
jgi:hypothetical protein